MTKIILTITITPPMLEPPTPDTKYCLDCAVRVRQKKEAERQRKRRHDSTHLRLDLLSQTGF